MTIELRFDLFKPSGKWAYGGKVMISGQYHLWDTAQLLEEIDANQSEVVKGLIKKRNYLLVISETEEQMSAKEYNNFYTHCFMPISES